MQASCPVAERICADDVVRKSCLLLMIEDFAFV
jgi:hypothetical protein